MLIDFFLTVKRAGIPVSVKEYLTLIEGLQKGVVSGSVDDFYFLARTTLVKDEIHFDRFDRAFGAYFRGIEGLADLTTELPEDWLRKLAELTLGPEERARVEALGGLDKLMEALRERLRDQQGRHQGGSKWIGTAGRSPFGAYGYNPEGVRIGQDGSRQRSACLLYTSDAADE